MVTYLSARHSRNAVPQWNASTTLSAADARLLQDRGSGAALVASRRGRPRPAPLHAHSRTRRRGRQGRTPHALARRRAARAVQQRRARPARRPGRAAHDLRRRHRRDAPCRARAARASPHRRRLRRGAVEDVRRGRSVAARVRRPLPAARRARRLRAGAGDVALDPLLLAFQLKLHGLAGFAPRLSAVLLLRRRGCAARALLGRRGRRRLRLLPGRPRRSRRPRSRRWPPCCGRRSPSCPSSLLRLPRSLPAAPPTSMPSTAASACARWR